MFFILASFLCLNVLVFVKRVPLHRGRLRQLLVLVSSCFFFESCKACATPISFKRCQIVSTFYMFILACFVCVGVLVVVKRVPLHLGRLNAWKATSPSCRSWARMWPSAEIELVKVLWFLCGSLQRCWG